MKIEHVTVSNREAALRGMRNPLNSWAKSTPDADIELGRKLSAAGPVHGKFLRMITITCDITAPLYWWKEFDTYKVGTVANSCSTMHTLLNKPFEISDFETDDIYSIYMKEDTINTLNSFRAQYFEYRQSGDEETAKKYWRTIIAMLPSAYLQKRTVLFNYEVMRRIAHDRAGHKLKEWQFFIDIMREELPLYKEFILGEKDDSNSEVKKTLLDSKEIDYIVYDQRAFSKLISEGTLEYVPDANIFTTRDTGNRLDSIEEAFKKKTFNEICAGFGLLPVKDDIQKKAITNDPINPAHYKDHCSVECIDAMVIAFGAWETAYFCMCNAFKYLWRHKYKNGREDLKKAIWYLDKAEELEGDDDKIDEFRKTVEKYMKEEEK